MTLKRVAGLWGIFLLSLCAAHAAHTKVSLLLSLEEAKPGDTVMAGIRLVMDPKWHTYWKNPGNSGMATEIEWQLPAGITAGEVMWPAPRKLPEGEITTYILEDEAVLLVPLQLSPDLSPGKLELKAKVSFLECEVQCVPGDAEVAAPLVIGSSQKKSANAELIAAWGPRMPKDSKELDLAARWESTPKPDVRNLLFSWKASTPSVDFYPDPASGYEVQHETRAMSANNGQVQVMKQVKLLSGEWPQKISGLIVEETPGNRKAFAVELRPAKSATAATPVAGGNLFSMMLYAFIGGLILNIMPCVLPVIALKILGFVNQSREEPRRVRMLGMVYGAGVLVSFLVLAGLVIGVKAAGHRAGWGMQFGNPQFLVLLTILVTLVALNLFGLFEVNPGSRVMGAAGSLAQRHGPSGAFFNGVLATILATPCTAPFLGAALGFAFAQSAPVIVLIFLTVGLGLASPYLLLSWNPKWLKFLPKPGMWMEYFKIAMGFPMLATAFWLFSLLPLHYGDRAWWLGVFLVIVALATWIYGTFVQKGERRRGLAMAIVALLLIGGYVAVAEGQLRWRSPQTPTSNAGQDLASGGISWKPWSAEAVTSARRQGKPVLVDFTAKWCLTCNTIVKPALESEAVRRKISETGTVPLLGDYTLFPPAITDELNRYGRAGVPLVLVFPKDPDAKAIVLPEAVTPGMVVDALAQATK